MGQLPYGVLPAGQACATARTPTAPAHVADQAGGRWPGWRLHARQRACAARHERAVAPARGGRRRARCGGDAPLGVDRTRSRDEEPGSPVGPSPDDPDDDANGDGAIHGTGTATFRGVLDSCPRAAHLQRAALAAPLADVQLPPTAATPDAVTQRPRWRVDRDRAR